MDQILKQDLEQITCTETHKFMVIGRGWIEAKALSIGDIILSANGYVSIEGIYHASGPKFIKVFNIEVENNFNYQVGETGVIVVDRWNSDELECEVIK